MRMVLEEQHEKTESTAQWKVKRKLLISVRGLSHCTGDRWREWELLVTGDCNQNEIWGARQELGKGQRVLQVGKEGQGVCSLLCNVMFHFLIKFLE